MSLFHVFSKKGKGQLPPVSKEADRTQKLEIYSGMRAEVSTDTGQILFVAKLMGIHGDKAELHQYCESRMLADTQSIHAGIRGYSDGDKKAVYMEGVITPSSKHIWQVEELTVVRIANDRAFFRLETNLDATATMFSGLAMGEKPCRLLNISVGGARVRSEYRYYKGDKFLLKVRLLEDMPESALFSEVVRVIEKEDAKFEYGCRFLGLTEANQEQITRNIFAAQRQKKGGF